MMHGPKSVKLSQLFIWLLSLMSFMFSEPLNIILIFWYAENKCSSKQGNKHIRVKRPIKVMCEVPWPVCTSLLICLLRSYCRICSQHVLVEIVSVVTEDNLKFVLWCPKNFTRHETNTLVCTYTDRQHWNAIMGACEREWPIKLPSEIPQKQGEVLWRT